MKYHLRKITSVLVALYIALSAAALPVFVSAHYIATSDAYELMAAVGADGHDHVHAPAPVVASDGHTDHSHESGGSELLVPGSARWFGLLGVSLVITASLSYWVYRYIQVAPVEKKTPEVSK